MAPMASSSPKPSDDDFPIAELVFSCTICQATVSDVYATVESNHGFHSGAGDEDGIVTKMWIAECSHITCAKHLENGAAPFHPQGVAPQAPCPKCVQDLGDDTPKELYSIRGLADGEYDPRIPGEWRRCPAIRLDGSVEGMEAVRFQYKALAHYSRQSRKHGKACQRRQLVAEAAYSKERKQRRQMQSEILELKSKVEALEKSEAKLKLWESRKPAINHYLGIVGPMAKDIERMGRQLTQLGFDVPKRLYAFNPGLPPQVPPKEIHDAHPSNGEAMRNASSSGEYLAADRAPHEGSSSSRKRKREEPAAHDHGQTSNQNQLARSNSRDMMPPPLPRFDQPRQYILERLVSPGEASSCHQSQIYDADAWQPSQTNNVNHQQRRDQQYVSHNSPFHAYGELPIRPSPVLYNQTYDLQPRYPEFERETGPDRSNPHDVRHVAYPDGRTGIQRPTSQAEQTLQRSLGPSANEEIQTDRDNRVFRDNAGRMRYYGSTGDGRHRHQQPKMSRTPLQPFVESFHNRQQAFSSQPDHPHSVSARRNTEVPAASVISPFFKQVGADSRPPTVQRPPTRGSFVRQSHASGQHLTTNQNPFTSATAQQPASLARSLNGLSFIERPHRPDHRPLSYRPEQNHEVYSRPQYPQGVPQTPRNSQGLFQRPDLNLPSTQYAPSRTQQSPYRSRMSLPPVRGPVLPLATSEDNALSQIRGVRGVSAQRSFSSCQHPSQSNQMARGLFSSASGRRSVRR